MQLHARESSSSSSSSFFRTLTSTSSPTPTRSSATSSFSPTSQSQPQSRTTSTLFSTGSSTSSPFLSTTASPPTTSPPTTTSPSSDDPPSSSDELPASSTPLSSPPSGFVFSTSTTSFVTRINGSPTTIAIPIVTALRMSQQSRSSSRTSIIAGSAAGGTALLIMALATLFCIQRRRRRGKRHRVHKRPISRPFLAEETGELDLPFQSPPQSPPFVSMNPFATYSSHRNSSSIGSSGSGGTPVYYRDSFSRSQSPSSHPPANVHSSAPLPPSYTSFTPPHLLRARASESGSIFQESVWPPPSSASQLMDPLTYPSQSVDLARVITDIMGPPESGPLMLLQPNTSSHEQGQGQEQDQGALNAGEDGEGEGEWRGAMTPSSIPANWSPRSELRSLPSSSPPSSPSRPRPPRPPRSTLRPPAMPWLTRPLNPFPKGSPLQRTLPS